MSEALYRKYRPQTFDDVVGQTHIERTLKNAIEASKVSHAYLFCGPRGTGKTTTARLLAKALLCEHGPTPSPDGTCEQCLAIAEGTHPDVNELDAASRTGVENVREEIINRVQYAPTIGRSKVYIIDEVHMLSTAAFNALLKTLEEPPSHVVFILCTTDPQKVPETIHSRCQRFDFHRLSNEEIVSRLGAVCMAEGVEFEGEALDLVAHKAQGGMRDALTTLEQLIAFGNGAVTEESARMALGSFDVDDMSAIVTHVGNRDAAACFTWVSEYVETGADLAQFVRDLAAYMRDLYVLLLTDGSIALEATDAARQRMAQEAKLFGADRLAYILRVLGDVNTELRSSSNPRLSFEIALTRMVRPQSDLTLEALAARVEALESALAQGAPVAPAQTQSGVFAGGAVAAASAASVAAGGVMPVASSAVVAPVSTGYKAAEASSAAPAPAAPSAAGQGSSMATRWKQSVASRSAASQQAAAQAGVPAQVAPAAQGASASGRSGTDGMAAVSAAAQPSAAPSAPVQPQAVPASSASAASAQASGPASANVKEKIANPAALQRGWQAALADLRKQRAAYGALFLSARVSAAADASSIVVEFSKENSFAYGAAQKPGITAALAQSLAQAFGGSVPFAITQGGVGAAAVAPAPVAAPAMTASVAPAMTASAAASAGQPASAPAQNQAAASVATQGAPARSRMAQMAAERIQAAAAAKQGSDQRASVRKAVAAPVEDQVPYGDQVPYDDVVPYDEMPYDDAATYGQDESYGAPAVPATPAASHMEAPARVDSVSSATPPPVPPDQASIKTRKPAPASVGEAVSPDATGSMAAPAAMQGASPSAAQSSRAAQDASPSGDPAVASVQAPAGGSAADNVDIMGFFESMGVSASNVSVEQ